MRYQLCFFKIADGVNSVGYAIVDLFAVSCRRRSEAQLNTQHIAGLNIRQLMVVVIYCGFNLRNSVGFKLDIYTAAIIVVHWVIKHLYLNG